VSLLTVSSFAVNEASHAIFTVRGAVNQVVNLSLVSGTATEGIDYGASLEIWDGNTWIPYDATNGLNLGSDQKALVRVAIVNDTVYEISETFQLKAADRANSSQFATGEADIRDNNTGVIFGDPTSTPGAIYMASPTATNVNELKSSTRSTTFSLQLSSGAQSVIVSSTGTTNNWGLFNPGGNQTANLYGESITIPSAYLDILPTGGSIARTINVDYGQTASALSQSDANFTYRYVIGIAGLGGENSASNFLDYGQQHAYGS